MRNGDITLRAIMEVSDVDTTHTQSKYLVVQEELVHLRNESWKERVSREVSWEDGDIEGQRQECWHRVRLTVSGMVSCGSLRYLQYYGVAWWPGFVKAWVD